jgi:hypothetical protein
LKFYDTLFTARKGFTLIERQAGLVGRRAAVFNPHPRSDVGLRVDYPASTEWERRDQQELYRILGAGGAAGMDEIPTDRQEGE